jgi:uncharacterized protein (DUF39 family)
VLFENKDQYLVVMDINVSKKIYCEITLADKSQSKSPKNITSTASKIRPVVLVSSMLTKIKATKEMTQKIAAKIAAGDEKLDILLYYNKIYFVQ